MSSGARTELTEQAEISPPFAPWTLYYLIPSAFVDAIKHLALGTESKDSTGDLKLDLSPLVRSAEAEEVYVTTSPSNWTLQKTPFWHLKEGLVETDDFMYITEAGWKSICDW